MGLGQSLAKGDIRLIRGRAGGSGSQCWRHPRISLTSLQTLAHFFKPFNFGRGVEALPGRGVPGTLLHTSKSGSGQLFCAIQASARSGGHEK